jgi:hypothetical protein
MKTKSTKTKTVNRKPYSKTVNPPVKHNASWTIEDNNKLTTLLLKGVTTKAAAEILGRTVASVWTRKSHLVRENIVPSKRFASSKTGNKYGKHVENRAEINIEEISEISPAPTVPVSTVSYEQNENANENILHGILKVLFDNRANSLIEMRNGKIKSIVIE